MRRRLALLTCCLLSTAPAVARQAVGFQIFASDDADNSSVLKTSMQFDFEHPDNAHYKGLSLETARFSPLGMPATIEHRMYYRFAGGGKRWTWTGSLGTDGSTWLGSASIHTEDAKRQEYFIEREIVETPIGLERGLYSTFAGAAWDLPLDPHDVLTATAGLQSFSGGNTRLHVRARYIRVLREDWGLTAQLRTRYFRNSDPHQFDYYSPRWYAEAIPTLQLRRHHGGWTYQAAAGFGRRRDADSQWQDARLFEASITSPITARNWTFATSFQYSNAPVATGYSYSYSLLTVQLMKAF